MSDAGRLEAIFFEALERGSLEERAAFLDEACGGDAELRHRVEKMLSAQADAGGFLESSPAADYAPTATMPTAAPPISEAAGSVIGPYKLLEQIGEGGFGVVFMAEQVAPVRRKVALKVIKPGMDTRQVIARFNAERQALAVMDHPNIARVYEAGATESGRPYFVMELVRGLPITAYCDEHNLPVRERLELFASVCQAIQHAHTKGIIHRDIKPTNVLVTRHDGRPVVKVIDFGVAKAMGQQLTEKTLFTEFAQMIGTPLYMSPEQAELSSLDIDTRSDIYSLGVLLYELLTGSTPVSKEELTKAGFDEIRRIIREDEPPRPSQRISGSGTLASIAAHRHVEPARLSRLVRGELDWIVMKALEKDRSRRYETASGFAADVQRYLDDESVQACPPSAGYRLRKFARRNRGSVLVTGLVFLVLVGGVVGTTLGMLRARQATREAQDARARVERERDGAVEARTETFGTLIDLTDFADQHLLFDRHVSNLAEQEFLRRLDALYARLGATLLGTGKVQDTRDHSRPEVGQTDDHPRAAARHHDAWRRAAELYTDTPPANPPDAARSDLRRHARRCRAVALTAEKLRCWPEAVEFSRRQLKFAHAARVPGERPDVELFNLLLTGNWCLTISLPAAGRVDEALPAWEEMVRLVVWFEPGGINQGACEHLSQIATRLSAAGQTADAATILAPGLAERRARLTANPSQTQTRIDLRRAYRVLGLIHEKSRRFRDALDAFDNVISLGELPPAGDDARVKYERSLVHGALIGRAVCLDTLGREADAETAWETVYALTESSPADWSVVRAMHLARNGQPERAVRMAEETVLGPGGAHPYNAACVFATASVDSGLPADRQEDFARRAVALLEEANTAGFFNEPKQVAHAKSDADLSPIRGRNDFKELMTRLEAGESQRQQ